MRIDAPPISNLRLTRFHTWAMLWLRGFLAFLDYVAAFAPLTRQAQAIAHQQLDRIEKIMLSIVILRAFPCLKPHARSGGFAQHRHQCAGKFRAVIGSKLRRALRSRDVSKRIAALSQNIDALVARLLARIPRGLTRRRPIRSRRAGAAPQIVQAPHTRGPSHDTSYPNVADHRFNVAQPSCAAAPALIAY